MATTIPFDFTSETPTLDADKVAAIVEVYGSAQRDEDKAGDPDDCTFYEGQKMAYLHVLNLLHGTTHGIGDDQPEVRFSIDPRNNPTP